MTTSLSPADTKFRFADIIEYANDRDIFTEHKSSSILNTVMVRFEARFIIDIHVDSIANGWHDEK